MFNEFNGVYVLREFIYGECARATRNENPNILTLTLTHTTTAYSVSGNVVGLCVHIPICATRHCHVEKEFTSWTYHKPRLPERTSPKN